MFVPLPPYPFALFSISIPPDTVYRHFIPFNTSLRRQVTTLLESEQAGITCPLRLHAERRTFGRTKFSNLLGQSNIMGFTLIDPFNNIYPGMSFRSHSDKRRLIILRGHLYPTSNSSLPNFCCSTLTSYRFARYTHVCRYNLVLSACRNPSILLHYTVRGSHMRSHANPTNPANPCMLIFHLRMSSQPHPLILCMSGFLVRALNYHKILTY